MLNLRTFLQHQQLDAHNRTHFAANETSQKQSDTFLHKSYKADASLRYVRNRIAPCKMKECYCHLAQAGSTDNVDVETSGLLQSRLRLAADCRWLNDSLAFRDLSSLLAPRAQEEPNRRVLQS